MEEWTRDKAGNWQRCSVENRSTMLQALTSSKEAERGRKNKEDSACSGSNTSSKGKDLEPVNKNHGVLQRKFQSTKHSLWLPSDTHPGQALDPASGEMCE